MRAKPRLPRLLFDAVRAEAARTTAGSVKDEIEKVVGMRDSITASLTRADPQALTLLRHAEWLVRDALGFSQPTAAQEAAPAGSQPVKP